MARLVEAGGKGRSSNWRPEVVEALENLRAAHPVDDETLILSNLILREAEKATPPKRPALKPLRILAGRER